MLPLRSTRPLSSGTNLSTPNHNINRIPQRQLDDLEKGYTDLDVDCAQMSQTCNITRISHTQGRVAGQLVESQRKIINLRVHQD